MIKPLNPEQFSSSKILSEQFLAKEISLLKAQGQTVGLCVGAYDLMHAGHIKHFETAKSLCDKLVVGISKDEFVTKRKGENRPVISDSLRAYSIANLSCVDFVTISPYERAVPLIKALQPSFYIKGAEYVHKQTPGITAEREAIASVGGEMRYTLDEKLSTTDILGEASKKSSKPVCIIAYGAGKAKSNLLKRFSARNNYVYLEDIGTTPKVQSSARTNLVNGFDVVFDTDYAFYEENIAGLCTPISVFLDYEDPSRNMVWKSNYDVLFNPIGDVEVNVEAFKHKIMNYLVEMKNE